MKLNCTRTIWVMLIIFWAYFLTRVIISLVGKFAGLILLLLIISCSKPYCEDQDKSSCEIFTNGDRDYITVKARGQHLCCWYYTFNECRYWTEGRINDEMVEWYQDIVNENPECLLFAENCGPSWEYGEVVY